MINILPINSNNIKLKYPRSKLLYYTKGNQIFRARYKNDYKHQQIELNKITPITYNINSRTKTTQNALEQLGLKKIHPRKVYCNKNRQNR